MDLESEGSSSLDDLYCRGLDLLKSEDTRKSGLRMVREAAEAGLARAQCELGHWYLNGYQGLGQNLEKALHWIERAAEGGDATAERFMEKRREAKRLAALRAATNFDAVWSSRTPEPGETCAVSKTGLWKRDAFAFDRLYVSCVDPDRVPDIPPELTFGIEEVDRQIAHVRASWMAPSMDGVPSEYFDIPANAERSCYADAGIHAAWIFSSESGMYRDFNKSETIAYEALLRNLPIPTDDHDWEQIIDFRNDQRALGHYRNLRLWLQHSLEADSVSHATDLIEQLVGNYRWSIRKHGLKTVTGSIAAIFDWRQSAATMGAAAFATTTAGPIYGTLAAGLMISAQVGASIADRQIDLQDIKRNQFSEVAMIYEAQKRFGSGG